MMESRILLLVCLLCQVCGNVESQVSVTVVIQQLRTLNDEMLKLKAEIPRIEEKLVNDVNMSELTLTEELVDTVMPGLIKGQLRETLSELFKEEPLEQTISNHVTSEKRDLKQEQSRMKKQYETMSGEIAQMKRQKIRMKKQLRTFYDAKIKILEDVQNQLMATLNTTLGKVKVLEGDRSRLTEKSNALENKVELLERKLKTNENRDRMTGCGRTTCRSLHLHVPDFGNVTDKHGRVSSYLLESKERIDLLEDRQQQLMTFKQTLRCNIQSGDTSTTAGKTAPTSDTVRSRLLLTSFYRDETESQQMTLDGHLHVLSRYPFLEVGKVISTAYDPTRNLIVFSRYYPDGIYTAELDGTGIGYLYNFIMSFGLAVDAGRQLIFMTTFRPFKTVSRITTFGRDFTKVVELEPGNNPIGIALDPENNMIYMSNHRKVFSVDYYGKKLQVLYEGNYMRGVALDLERSVLYFNDDMKIMKGSLHGNSSEVVATWINYPLSMKYYNDIVYVSCIYEGMIYTLDVNTEVFKEIAWVDQPSTMCLIP